jgi:tRNA(Ser,Leu) C12 N-acetylase TAN1
MAMLTERSKAAAETYKNRRGLRGSMADTVKNSGRKTAHNLLVTYHPRQRAAAAEELDGVLRKIGEAPKIVDSTVEGVLLARVSDSRRVVNRLRDLMRADPSSFMLTYHYTPIDTWCTSTLTAMQTAITSAAKGIDEHEKWCLDLHKRNWDKLDGVSLKVKLTKDIKTGTVSLEHPQKIIQVEILSHEAGISLLSPSDILDVRQAKS